MSRPTAPIDEYLTKMEQYLALGYSLYRSCVLSGVPYSTVNDYFHDDQSFRERVEGLILAPNVMARRVWIKHIEGGDYRAAKEWLERVETEDFQTGSQITVSTDMESNDKRSIEEKLTDILKRIAEVNTEEQS